MSIRHLLEDEVISEVEKVKLGIEYGVSEWVSVGALNIAFANFDAYPLEELARTFGWETAAKILWIKGKERLLDSNQEFRVDLSKLHCSSCPAPFREDQLQKLSCTQGHFAEVDRFWDSDDEEGGVVSFIEGMLPGRALLPFPLASEECQEQIRQLFPE